ncbi:hypothetical protein VPH35_122892 [Triticum aestivum]
MRRRICRGVRWLHALGDGRSSSSTTRACCSPPPSIGWSWSWAPLNLSGRSPPESPWVEARCGLATAVSFHLCNVLQLCIITTFCTPADSSQGIEAQL